MNRWTWIVCLLVCVGCGETTDSSPGPVDPADTNPPPICLTLPSAEGTDVTITKGPYLQWPTPASMVVRMEAAKWKDWAGRSPTPALRILPDDP